MRSGLAAGLSTLALTASMSGAAMAAERQSPTFAESVSDLSQLSLEELSTITVTSVSKRAESIATAPSAVYVITPEDIRRSPARSLPELLREAPNLEITRVDALDYSITARGFGGFESAEKLLVLIDGRSVYTPLFSGVDWDQHNVLLDDLARIEVVSGPGGTLYGANAVNGVINITSKAAFDTKGLLLTAAGGDLDSDAGARLGGSLGGDAAGRLYLMGVRRGPSRTADGGSVHDRWNTLQGGFRLDWARGEQLATLQGDAHNGALNNSLGLSGFIRGQNLLGRWTLNRRDGRGGLQVQAYYDHFSREARLIHDELTTGDLQVQQTLTAGAHQWVLGAGYRSLSDNFRTLSEPQLLSPPRRRTSIANVFAQDEIALRPDLRLTLGLKVERNSYTRTEAMPNARLAWRVNERQFVWAAVSRAVRDPSRIERDFQIPGLVVPGRMQSEKLVAYEAGYRGWLGPRLNLSLSAYYNAYDEIRTNDLTPPGVLPIFVGNNIKGATYGLEAWGDVDLASWWRLRLGGSLLGRDFRKTSDGVELAQFKSVGADPHHWFKITSQMQLRPDVDLDLGLRGYGDIEDAPNAALVAVPAYTELSARLAWRANDHLELAVSGQDLLHAQHLESIELRRRYIPRSVTVSLRWTP